MSAENQILCIVAVSGDVSARGISDVADVIKIDKKHYDLVSKFLLSQSEYENDLYFGSVGDRTFGKYLVMQSEMLKNNIFTNKYQKRSFWKVVYYDELNTLTFKYKVLDKIELSESEVNKLQGMDRFNYMKQYNDGTFIPKVGMYCNRFLYSDVNPFEIIEVSKSGKTITIRDMDYKLDPNWKPKFVEGGFAGHCTNDREQKWIITSKPKGSTLKLRLSKKGYGNGYYKVAFKPSKHHDYNF